jgi:hypothetical protein
MKASMVGLIILHNAECFYRMGRYSDALVHLDMLTRIKNYTDSEYSKSLDSKYPRFPRISDSNMVDDAQVLKALCHLRLAEAEPARNQRLQKYKEGVLELVNTFLFFPYLDQGVSMERNSEALIKALREENEGQLKKLTDQIESSFLLAREWPVQNER